MNICYSPFNVCLQFNVGAPVNINKYFWLSLQRLLISFQEKYVFKHPQPKRPKSLRIYEAHVGMSSTVCVYLFVLNNYVLGSYMCVPNFFITYQYTTLFVCAVWLFDYNDIDPILWIFLYTTWMMIMYFLRRNQWLILMLTLEMMFFHV